MISNILQALGFNETIWVQFLIFWMTYWALQVIVIKPYFAAFLVRQSRTAGDEAAAQAAVVAAADLEQEFQVKAREYAARTNEIFTTARKAGQEEYESRMALARQNAKQIIEGARAQLKQQLKETGSHIEAEQAVVSRSIVSHLLGKEVGR